MHIDCQWILQKIGTIISQICKVNLTFNQIPFAMDNTHLCVNISFAHIATQNMLYLKIKLKLLSLQCNNRRLKCCHSVVVAFIAECVIVELTHRK